MSRPAAAIAVSARRPRQQLTPQDETWLACFEHKRAIGELAVPRLVKHTLSFPGREALPVELRVDRVRSDLARMQAQPEVAEAVVVAPSALCARPVPGCQGRDLVKEEQFGEAARRHKR